MDFSMFVYQPDTLSLFIFFTLVQSPKSLERRGCPFDTMID